MPDRKDIPDWLPVIRSDTAVKYTTIVDAIANAIDNAIGIPGAVTELPVTPQRLKAIIDSRR